MLIRAALRTRRALWHSTLQSAAGRASVQGVRYSSWSTARPSGTRSQSTHSYKFGVAAIIIYTAALAYAGSVNSSEDNPLRNEPQIILDKARLTTARYATLSEMIEAIEEIRQACKHDEEIISTDEEDLKAHGFSEWSSVDVGRLPNAVAYPKNTEMVSIIARICHKHKVPLIPYSGGSSLEGHTSAPYGGVSIDFVHMDQIIKINEGDMDAVVQPSVLWVTLNEHLAKRKTGLFFPMDPAPSAKIGGMIGTNCSGTNAVRYGTMRDWVVNLTVVLADGTVIKTRRRPRKSSAGYSLNHLFVGSEGTLGIVTEATVRLAPVPACQSVAVVPFTTIHRAVSAATSVVRAGIPVAAVELMDEIQMQIVNEVGATRPRTWREQPTLFFKFSGTPGTVKDNIQSVRQIVSAYEPQAFEFASTELEQQTLWSARKESLYSLLARRKENEEMWNTDVAVPLSRLGDMVEACKQDAAELGINACVKGHVGDGNFHENITYNTVDPGEYEKAKEAVQRMVDRALDMEGTCTGEHGIGYGKKASLQKEVGDNVLNMMKVLKATLDPYWILNPGKVFDSEGVKN